jgi:hemerythrin-like metal-binding protein
VSEITLKALDEQHALIREKLHDVSNALMLPDSDIVGILQGLRDLLLPHFRDEEALMEQVSYPEVSGHKWQHEALTAGLIHVIASVRGGRMLTTKDFRILRAICEDHTNEADGDFVAFCASRQAQ